MTVLSFVSAVNSALLHSTVRRRGSRSSLNETGMTVISFISVILVAPKRKKPTHLSGLLFFIGSLAVFYSHMGAENGFKQANCFACSVRSGFASGEDWGPPSGTDDREVELSVLLKRKKADLHGRPFSFQLGAWRCSTLTWGDPTLPSTLTCFTSEFGMDSGGTTSLLPPGINFL